MSDSDENQPTITFSDWISSIICVPICQFFEEERVTDQTVVTAGIQMEKHQPVSLYDFATQTRDEMSKEDSLQ